MKIKINPQDQSKVISYIFGFDKRDNVFIRKSKIDEIELDPKIKLGTYKFSSNVSKQERSKILEIL